MTTVLPTVSKPSPATHKAIDLIAGAHTLNERLRHLHDHLLETVPSIDRIACALYDATEDKLKTFINSTRDGEAISAYEFRLADSPSLSALAQSGEFRVIDDIPAVLQANSQHSAWVLKQGYRSSFTVPIYGHGEFLGFIFYDSLEPEAFPAPVQRDLALYSTLLTMAITSELGAVRALIAAAQAARDFAQLRDFETGMHLERMARYARLIARVVAPRHGKTDEFVEHVFLFAPLHDIGKIGIPDHILLKPGKLDAHERAVIQTHVALGVGIVEKILGNLDLTEFADATVMLDGSGYPQGLAGALVPLEARIIATADIFDALTSLRPYKPAWSLSDALAELRRMADAGKLDPDCVAALDTHPAEIADILAHCQDQAPHA